MCGVVAIHNRCDTSSVGAGLSFTDSRRTNRPTLRAPPTMLLSRMLRRFLASFRDYCRRGEPDLKARSYLAVLLVGFGMAMDFTAVMMSIQPFFYYLGGHESLYGFVFGSYDLSQMFSAPLLGHWVDRNYENFKPAFLWGLVINALGNLLYAFTALIDNWGAMLASRLVSGLGSGLLAVGAAYISLTTSFEDRNMKLGQYRISQSLARQVGPFLGYLFLWIPPLNESGNNSTAHEVFNWFTAPGWVTFFVVVILFIFVARVFVNPSVENKHLVPVPANTSMDNGVWSFVRVFFPLHFLVGLSFWAFTSNLFGLIAGQYHAVSNQQDNWKTFLGLGCGAVVGSIFWRRMVTVGYVEHVERYLVVLAQCFGVSAWLLTINYSGTTNVPPSAWFYAGTACAGIGISLYYASSEVFFSKKMTQYRAYEKMARLISLYTVVSAGSRFAGPFISGGVTRIATPDGETHSPTCNALDPDGYVLQGCVLYNSVVFYSVMAGFSGLVVICSLFFFKKYGPYGNNESSSPENDSIVVEHEAKKNCSDAL